MESVKSQKLDLTARSVGAAGSGFRGTSQASEPSHRDQERDCSSSGHDQPSLFLRRHYLGASLSCRNLSHDSKHDTRT